MFDVTNFDLISRKEAIEAVYYRPNCKSAVSELRTVPFVDAIPVEWLESKRKEALHDGMRPDEVESVEMVLWMWQREKGCNNGACDINPLPADTQE